MTNDGASLWHNRKEISIFAQKAITIGSNDGINVQVVSGLNVGEKVATNLQGDRPQVAGGDSKNSDSSSPFMPKRPNRNNSKAK